MTRKSRVASTFSLPDISDRATDLLDYSAHSSFHLLTSTQHGQKDSLQVKTRSLNFVDSSTAQIKTFLDNALALQLHHGSHILACEAAARGWFVATTITIPAAKRGPSIVLTRIQDATTRKGRWGRS